MLHLRGAVYRRGIGGPEAMSGRRQYNEDGTTIKLSSGGSVSLTFRGTLFELTEPEQVLISELTNLIRKYRDAAALTEASKNGDKS
jgi:hypothetical protein